MGFKVDDRVLWTGHGFGSFALVGTVAEAFGSNYNIRLDEGQGQSVVPSYPPTEKNTGWLAFEHQLSIAPELSPKLGTRCATCGDAVWLDRYCRNCNKGSMGTVVTGFNEEIGSDPVSDYERLGAEIGKLVADKNRKYGDSFMRSGAILEQLYPNGIKPEQYADLLAITRVLDKLFRIATNGDPNGENPWLDCAGYSLLAVHRNSK